MLMRQYEIKELFRPFIVRKFLLKKRRKLFCVKKGFFRQCKALAKSTNTLLKIAHFNNACYKNNNVYHQLPLKNAEIVFNYKDASEGSVEKRVFTKN